MLHVRADGLGKCVKQNLSDDERANAESDVPQWPALKQGADNQHNLHDDVDEKEDGGENVDNDEESNRVVWVKTTPSLESEQGDHKADDEHGQTADAQQPDRKRCTVLIELETNETVDHQANAGRACETTLYGDEVGVSSGSGWYDAAVNDQRADREEGVQVEEGCDFLAACDIPVSQIFRLYFLFIPLFCPSTLALSDVFYDIPTAVNLLRT